MRIGIIGSMQFIDRMVEARDELVKLGHDAFVTSLHRTMVGRSREEIEEIKLRQKRDMDAIRVFWNEMQGADAVLVMNLDKDGVRNYVGGNTLMEIGFAHVLGQRIFLWNPVPDTPWCRSEIEAMKPTVIDGDLSRVG